MREPIAKIALAPGQVGYYDQYSRVHLTLGKPEAIIYSGTNCAQIRRSIKAGTIRLVSGTLGEQIPPLKLVKTKKGMKLISNVAKEHEPVHITTKTETQKEVQQSSEEVVETEQIQEVSTAENKPVESIELVESVESDEKTEQIKTTETIEEAQEEPQKKKTTRRKKTTEEAKTTEK